MADINTLLNPVPEASRRIKTSLSSPTSHPRDSSPPPTPRKKPKLAKDAAVYKRGKPKGTVNYPPFESVDEELLAQQQDFGLHPVGNIADFPRHIPYNSDKKSFLDKTARESFEVFQYNFAVPGYDKTCVMMWDYNIGLVRTTPLFKCLGHSKTTPSKMLNKNPGLRDICHSITGGALVAQGYWMPFEAARAVAATFCWSIRYALTPIFGPDFPSTCVSPESEKFGDMTIDPSVTQLCARNAQEYREREGQSSSRASSVLRTPVTPDSPNFPDLSKRLLSRRVRLTGDGSGYGTDSSDSYSNYQAIGASPYDSSFTPVNTPRASPNIAHQRITLPSPQEMLAGSPAFGNEGSSRITTPARPTKCTKNDNDMPKHQSVEQELNVDSSSTCTTTQNTNNIICGKEDVGIAGHDVTGLTEADENAAMLLLSMRLMHNSDKSTAASAANDSNQANAPRPSFRAESLIVKNQKKRRASA